MELETLTRDGRVMIWVAGSPHVKHCPACQPSREPTESPQLSPCLRVKAEQPVKGHREKTPIRTIKTRKTGQNRHHGQGHGSESRIKLQEENPCYLRKIK